MSITKSSLSTSSACCSPDTKQKFQTKQLQIEMHGKYVILAAVTQFGGQ